MRTAVTALNGSELVKELGSGRNSEVRPSRQPPCPEEPPQAASRRGGFLRMRTVLNVIKIYLMLRSASKGAS
jgi:hypothetical protein